MVVKQRNAVGLEQRAQSVLAPRFGGLGQPQEHAGDLAAEPGSFHNLQGSERLHQCLWRVARLRGDDEPAGGQVEAR